MSIYYYVYTGGGRDIKIPPIPPIPPGFYVLFLPPHQLPPIPPTPPRVFEVDFKISVYIYTGGIGGIL